MRTRPLVALTLSALALLGCDADDVTRPLAPMTPSPTLTDVAGVAEVVGEVGPGASYVLLKPANWNGGLVLWAHGYVQPFLPARLPEGEYLAQARDHLLEAGYGFAFSSYSHTGYAVKDGAERTHQLRGLFADAFGDPERTYLVGTSLGGTIVGLLSERFPAQYDGTLAACGALDGLFVAEYVAHVRVLFDWFFQADFGESPLPGSLYQMPGGYYLIPPDQYPPNGSPAYQAVVGALTGALSDPETQWVVPALASLDQVDLKYESAVELVTGLTYVLGYQINGANALTEQLNGHGYFDNDDDRYSGGLVDPGSTLATLLNDPDVGVERYTADPAGEEYMERWWVPTGELSSPFLTIHTTRDPLVPYRVEDRFRATVEAAGHDDLLVQRAIDRFGHCTYDIDDLIRAIDDLILWVEQGVKPDA